MLRSLTILIISLFISELASAQQNMTQASSQPLMEHHGKIYVVMFVCLVVLGGLITYLFVLDRSIAKMEKEKK